MARTIAERKTWKKYGLSKNDKPGPNPATTITAEDVFMHVCWGLGVGQREGGGKGCHAVFISVVK